MGNARAGEGASGGAVTFSSKPPWAVHSLVLTFFGAREKGEEEKV
jgi:hypothetical protein